MVVKHLWYCSIVPRLLPNVNMCTWGGPGQRFFCVVQSTMHSMLSVYNIHPLITRDLQSVACYLHSFPVLSLRVRPRTIKVSLYPLSTFTAFHVTKTTRLSMPAHLQCSHSGAWEPGNEVRNLYVCKTLMMLLLRIKSEKPASFRKPKF